MSVDLSKIESPKYDENELNYVINPDLKKPMDVRYIISRVFDGSKFLEFKRNYGPTLVTGFAKLYG